MTGQKRHLFDPGLHPGRLKAAATEMARRLRELGVQFGLIGGLTMSVYAESRVTMDVDFLVSNDARGRIIGGSPLFIEGISLKVKGAHVDLLFPEDAESFLEEGLVSSRLFEGIPVLVPEAIVYLKLKAGRVRDENDVASMVRAGLDVAKVSAYLSAFAPHLVEDFEAIVVEVSQRGY